MNMKTSTQKMLATASMVTAPMRPNISCDNPQVFWVYWKNIAIYVHVCK